MVIKSKVNLSERRPRSKAKKMTHVGVHLLKINKNHLAGRVQPDTLRRKPGMQGQSKE
jgi:hypothetical protein